MKMVVVLLSTLINNIILLHFTSSVFTPLMYSRQDSQIQACARTRESSREELQNVNIFNLSAFCYPNRHFWCPNGQLQLSIILMCNTFLTF